MMETLASALEPYQVLPGEAIASVVFLVFVAGGVIIFAASEIMSRGLWNQRFREGSTLSLGPMLRSHEQRGRQQAE